VQNPTPTAKITMTWPEGVAVELIVLAIVWNGVKLCTRNVRRFLDLRLEIRRQVLRFLDQGARPSQPRPTQPGDDPHVTHEAEPDQQIPAQIQEFAELGFRMLALAQSDRVAFWIVKMMGYDPIKAGDNLISFSQEAAPAFRLISVGEALHLEEAEPDEKY
jgi:hypothetical protein